MGYRARKDNDGRSKLHAVRQHRTSKNHAGLSSCIHRCVGGEGLRKVRNYIMKALDFGVESGYLVPTDRTYRMLRVSSDLLAKKKKKSSRNKTTRCSSKTCEKWSSRRNDDDEEEDEEVQSPTRFEDYPVQDGRRKQKPRRRRSVSKARRRRRSRSRQRRRRGSGNPDEAGKDDDDDDYDTTDNSVKKTSGTEHTSKELKGSRSKTQNNGKSNAKEADDLSEVSIDEDDTDEDDDKKGNDNTKS